MSLNKVTLNFTVPNFGENYQPKYTQKEDGKSSYFYSVSVKRSFKKQDEKYYPTDLIPIKAFGTYADILNKYFAPGSGNSGILEGRLEKQDDYEKDGQTIKGGLIVLVEKIHFVDGVKSENTKASNTSTTPSSPKKPGPPGQKMPSLPGVAKKPTLPSLPR